tara:strand:- start:1974 stop:2585 length:612 start_codon:yes stop_codon:yes gene_type:complete
MKNKALKKSLFFSISIIIFLRLLLFFIPIYSSETTIKIDDYQYNILRENLNLNGVDPCLKIIPSYDRLTNNTKFYLTSRSIKKESSIKCIDNGVGLIESAIAKTNSVYKGWISESKEHEIDNLINEFNVSKSLDKNKLKKINEYFRSINKIRNKEILLLPLSYEIKTIPIKNNNLFRFLFSGFIVIFWISFFVLSDLEKISDD